MSTLAKLSAREKSLIDRGYAAERVKELCFCSDDDLEQIVKKYTALNFQKVESVVDPVCVLLGGQPGSGKSTYMHQLLRDYPNKYVPIGLDYYRTWHPNYRIMENEIKLHWEQLTENEYQSPGNDIADFTHSFAGKMSDRVIAHYRKASKNMIIEWGLRSPEEPLAEMSRLKDMGYQIEVVYIASDPVTSMKGCELRASLMMQSGHIMRRVPRDFHDLAVSAMSESSRRIWMEGYRNNICDSITIYDRTNRIIWNSEMGTDPYPYYERVLKNEKIEEINCTSHVDEVIQMELLGLTTEVRQ